MQLQLFSPLGTFKKQVEACPRSIFASKELPDQIRTFGNTPGKNTKKLQAATESVERKKESSINQDQTRRAGVTSHLSCQVGLLNISTIT